MRITRNKKITIILLIIIAIVLITSLVFSQTNQSENQYNDVKDLANISLINDRFAFEFEEEEDILIFGEFTEKEVYILK
jgi:uncharacterized protein YpmB